MSTAPRRTVGLLDLYARQDGFQGDRTLDALVSDLREHGHRVVSVRSIASESGLALAPWVAAIAHHAKSEGCDVVVLPRVWDRAIIDTLRAELGPDVMLVRQSTGVRASLDEAFDHVLDAITLVSFLDGVPHADTVQYLPITTNDVRRLLKRAPVVADNEAVDPVGRATQGRPTITGPALGCPFLLDSRNNPVFRDVGLDPNELQTRGCTFCLDNSGVYAMPSETEVVESWMAQWRAIRAARPEAREVLLVDERPHPFLPAFFRAIAEDTTLRGIELLIKSRVDWLLEYGDNALSEAATEALRSNSVLHVYLVGFENFDPFHLQLFNKGVTVEDNARAVAKLRELGKRFPDSFEYRRHRAHGIVLFTPWTDPEALLTNARWMRKLGFDELRSEAVRTRLRLYPRVPLHALAARDGLLAERFENDRSDRATEQGYDASAPWRFRDPRTEAIYHVAIAAHDWYRALSDADVLELATRYVLRFPGLAAVPQHAFLPLRYTLVGWGAPADRTVAWIGAAGAIFDVEIEAIFAGRKRAALKETVAAEHVAGLMAAYRAMGLHAEVVSRHDLAASSGTHLEGGAFAIVAVAHDAESLAQVLDRQRALSQERGREAIDAMGALMGYPQCCVDAFVELPDRGDNRRNERAPFRRHPDVPLDSRLNRLGNLKLASHHLCSPGCAASVQIVEETLARIGALSAEAEAWLREDLSSPVLFVDYSRRVPMRGAWEGDRFRVDSARPVEDQHEFAAAMREAQWLTLSTAAVRVFNKRGEVRRIEGEFPLLVEPGHPLRGPALAAVGGASATPNREEHPAPAQGETARGLPPLPEAFRAGTAVREHRIADIRRGPDGYHVTLGRGAGDVVQLQLRRVEPGRAHTLRTGPWAIDVDAPERLSAQAREALRVFVAALPR